MCRVVVLCLCFVFCSISSAHAAPLKACLKTDTGQVIVKRRCKAAKGQQEVNAELLQGIGSSQVGPQGPAGPVGPQGNEGPAGPQGIPGLDGVDGLTGFEIVTTDTGPFSLISGATQVENTLCPAGKVVLGGGCDAMGTNVILKSSVMNFDETGWFCHVMNIGSFQVNNARIITRVQCGSVS